RHVPPGPPQAYRADRTAAVAYCHGNGIVDASLRPLVEPRSADGIPAPLDVLELAQQRSLIDLDADQPPLRVAARQRHNLRDLCAAELGHVGKSRRGREHVAFPIENLLAVEIEWADRAS